MSEAEREAYERGERRHEACRYGTLNAAFEIPAHGGPERPSLVPICNWNIPSPHPPAAGRAWGGAVEYARDCALCDAFSPLGETDQ